MPEPILAVDFGRFQTSAALLVGEQWHRLSPPATPTWAVPDPGTGASWPPVGVAERTGPDALAAALAPIGGEAHRRHGGPVERLALAAAGPAASPALLAAGRAAGFPDVELVPDAVAAVLDPASGPDFGFGDLVLVCDPGPAGTTALVRVAGNHTAVLGREALPEAAGQELEARLRWLVDSCDKLAGDAGVEPTGVVLTGGWLARRDVLDHLRQVLPGRIRPAVDPELSVLRGVIRWAAAAGRRRVPAEPPRWRVEPLSWRIPDRDARVLRWLAEEGTPFAAGSVVAQVRTGTDQVYDLTAATDGALLSHGVAAGGRTGPTLVAAMAPGDMPAGSHGQPAHRHRWLTTGGWMLTPQLLVEWDGAGRYVHTRDLVDGAVAGELRPDHGPGQPRRAGVFVDPAGRFCLLTWDLDGSCWVWDIGAAALRTRFTVPASAARVLVNEEGWRLAVEERDAVSVGRYRRTAVTFWDLDGGHRIDRVVADDWGRRHPGYAARSGADRFTTDATSPDRRLRAVAAEGSLNLYETATDRSVFRSSASPHARTAFSADGRFLLATWDTDDRSTVDVWQL